MRNKEENAALLKSIRRDLRGWEEGVKTHSDYGLTMGMGGVCLYLVTPPSVSHLMAGLFFRPF